MHRKGRKRAGHVLSQAADIDGDCRLARQGFAHGPDHAQRVNGLFLACRKLGNLAVAQLELGRVAFGGVIEPDADTKRWPNLPDSIEHLFQNSPDVADYGKMRRHATADLGCVDIDLDHARGRRRDKSGSPVGFHLLEACAERRRD